MTNLFMAVLAVSVTWKMYLEQQVMTQLPTAIGVSNARWLRNWHGLATTHRLLGPACLSCRFFGRTSPKAGLHHCLQFCSTHPRYIHLPLLTSQHVAETVSRTGQPPRRNTRRNLQAILLSLPAWVVRSRSQRLPPLRPRRAVG